MRIEFVYGPFSSGQKEFNFERLLEDPAGLTGSESACFFLAREMAKRGHEVSIYTKLSQFLPNPYDWYGVKVWRLGWFTCPRKPPDVCYSWNEPELLKYAHPGSVRMMNQQLNDFDYCIQHCPEFDTYIDIYTSPSPSHLEYVSQFTPNKTKWKVLPNGVDLSLFDLNCKKIPGSVIYASSPDRGLHLLLQEWPKIKNAVPNATLKIFYDCTGWFNMAHGVVPYDNNITIGIRESATRGRYADYALSRMRSGYGIIHYKSVSKQHLAREMSMSMVLAYPCDTTRFTEGFSVTTLEACASGMFPVISSIDSLGQIYGEAVPMAKAPVIKDIDSFTNLVIRGLTDTEFRNKTVEKTLAFSQKFTWSKIAEELDNIMVEGIIRKSPSN